MIDSLTIPEIFKKVRGAKNRNEKIEILRNSSSPALKETLKYMFNTNIEMYTKTPPPHMVEENAPEGVTYNSLYNEYKRYYIFEKRSDVDAARKNELMIQVLESVHPNEAEIVKFFFDRKPSFDGITKKMTKEAFPDLEID